jgi:hypothetical protein
MPKRHLDDPGVDYYLTLFDRHGNERPETDGTLLSAELADLVVGGVTDVFVASHGWMGDVPAAIRQYDRWVAAMARQTADLTAARSAAPGFSPLTVAVHWPSLPWGDERAASALLDGCEDDEFAAEREMSPPELVNLYVERLSGTDAARAALAAILAAEDDRGTAAALERGEMPAEVEAAYRRLVTEAGLEPRGAGAAPGLDQEAFDPAETIDEWRGESAGAPGQPGLLGGNGRVAVRDLLLAPVRQLSFWSMKRRACCIGETGVHWLLAALQQGARSPRLHLMGHSFGCIVVTAAAAGPIRDETIVDPLPHPVSSMILVQGAMSLWSFAAAIPYPPSAPGYFRPALAAPAAVDGPIVVTRSQCDRAVGTFYPLGSRISGERVLGDDDFPEFGGIGTFGVRGAAPSEEQELLADDASYRLNPGCVYNVDASAVIREGGGPSGAHNDIAHPRVAHLFWEAALCGIRAGK